VKSFRFARGSGGARGAGRSQLLEDLKSRPAGVAFATIIKEEEDPYVLRAVASALARIGGDSAQAIVARLVSHPSVIVRRSAEDAL
jgi:HEAT repeat protein